MNFFCSHVKTFAGFRTIHRVYQLDILEPVTRRAVLGIISDAAKQGIDLLPFETYRSRERQELLFARGATELRQVGTHHYGLACDLVRLDQGKLNWQGDYSFLSQLAREHKLIWGGDWGFPGKQSTLADLVHVQRCSILRQTDLFAEVWYPQTTYNPYADLAVLPKHCNVEH